MMPSQIDRLKTGILLKNIMDKKGITAKDIKEYFNFSSVQSVYHWLEGKSLPTLENVYGLSDLLGVPVDELLYGDRKAVYSFRRDDYFRRISYYFEAFRRFAIS